MYDIEGRLLWSSQKTYETKFPVPGWAEQNPNDWWEALRLCVREAVKMCPHISVKAIAIDATSSTVLAVGSNGEPLTNAILWMDIRASEQAKKINATNHPILSWCGKQVSPEWFLPKLLWIKEHLPEIYRKAYLIVEALDWLNYKLTGKWVASQCNASCKWNYLPGEGWSIDFLEAIGVPELVEKIPSQILPVGSVIGNIKKDVAHDIGCEESVLIVQGGIDAHIATIGLGSFGEREGSLILGSSSVLLVNARLQKTLEGFWGPYKDPIHKGLSLIEGGQTSSGSIIDWFIKKVAKHYSIKAKATKLNPYEWLDDEASKVPPGSEGLIVLDHWQGNRTPYKDPYSRGIIWGLSLNHEASHIGRAIYEGIAFGIRLLFDHLEKAGIGIKNLKVCGGGTRSKLWLQILSDICEKEMWVTQENASLLGGAILAATGASLFPSIVEAFAAMKPNLKVIKPVKDFSEYLANYELYQKLYVATKPLRR
ncbi:FGGY-family carbohydrate kinase [Thermatribacter velox]|uniref:FGGY-family carbohydrate kinase n=1 Tax=Thermatribacter velox TaxID=3039681 RepID=A0ABZ2YDX5_9BACT